MDLMERQGHAALDLQSRNAKARKIEALLGLTPTGRPLRLLEVGTGSGGIAHYFGTHPTLRCEVDAVDVTDTRQIHDGFASRGSTTFCGLFQTKLLEGLSSAETELTPADRSAIRRVSLAKVEASGKVGKAQRAHAVL